MDWSNLVVGIAGLSASLAGGATGKKIGLVSGSRPWQKILGPIGAASAGMVYESFTGGSGLAKDIILNGGLLGAIAVGVFSVLKNVRELVLSIKRG